MQFSRPRIALYVIVIIGMAAWIPANMWLERHDSALLHAVITGDVPAAHKSFDEGANVHMQIRQHFTLLQVAARQGSVEMARLLIEHGADLTATNDGGDTALKIALNNNHAEMAAYLQSLIVTSHADHAP
jgi:ankyrin repeat protein